MNKRAMAAKPRQRSPAPAKDAGTTPCGLHERNLAVNRSEEADQPSVSRGRHGRLAGRVSDMGVLTVIWPV